MNRARLYGHFFKGNFALFKEQHHLMCNFIILMIKFMKKRCFLLSKAHVMIVDNLHDKWSSTKYRIIIFNFFVKCTVLEANNVPFLMSSFSQRPIGFSLHLGWCHVTERLWSHNATTTSAPLSPSCYSKTDLVHGLYFLTLSLLWAPGQGHHSHHMSHPVEP